MKKSAVFIDRDGTINEQRGFVNHLSRFALIPGVADAVKLLNKNNFLSIIVTNQSGVARGYYPVALVHEVHELMTKYFEKEGATIDAIFYCPHHPRGIVPEFTSECDCRKPKTGLVNQALEAFDIDMSNSYVIGDRYVDIKLALRMNLRGILVKTGYGLGEMEYVIPGMPIKPSHVAEDLLDAVKWILSEEKE